MLEACGDRKTATIRGPEAGASIPIDTNDALNGAIDRAARNISRRYGCSVKLKAVREIVFDFEH